MNDRPLHIALAAIARPTFDVPLAQSVADEVVRMIDRTGAQIGGSGATLIMNAEGAAAAESALRETPFDLLLILQASFADSTMAVALAQVAHEAGVPILLWAAPDARDGGRLRLNSLCGINLAGHALHLRGIAYEYLFTQPNDPDAVETIRTLAAAGRARRLMRVARIGVVGEHPAGFDTCAYEPDDLTRLVGVEVEPIALAQVLDEARAAPDEARRPFLQRAAALASNLGEVDQQSLSGTAGVHAALSANVAKRKLSGVAVRCWPEFFTELGCAACGAMSVLSEAGCPASCEADVNGTVTSLVLQAIADAPAFIADLVSIEPESDTGVLWHCGLAPSSMADESIGGGIRATVHGNRKLPLLFEFALKPGRVTMARLHRTRDGDGALGYALVVGGGEMLRAPRSYSGTSGVVRFDAAARTVLDRIMRMGMEHHLCMVYGDHLNSLRAFARLAGLPVIELTA